MKNLKSLFMSLLALVALTLVSCEGPAGKDGAAGTNGKDGKDGKDAMSGCIQCHGTAEMDLYISQYEVSKHGTGIVWEEEAGRVACGGCHAGTGFIEAVKLGKDDPATASTGPINCKTCHTIHTKFDTTDFALRITKGWAMRHNPTNKTEVVDFKGSGNLCAKCHQARTYTRTVPDTVKPAGAGYTYSRIGPHYGVIANVVANKGLETITGTATPAPTGAPHMALAKGCVTCHMSKDPTNTGNGQHTFRMPLASLSAIIADCAPCHTDVNVFKNYMTATGNGGKIKADLALIRAELIKRKMLDTSAAVTAEGYLVIAEYAATPDKKNVVYTNPNDVAVILNYLYVAKERSFGVHNPPVVRGLVKQMKEYLGL